MTDKCPFCNGTGENAKCQETVRMALQKEDERLAKRDNVVAERRRRQLERVDVNTIEAVAEKLGGVAAAVAAGVDNKYGAANALAHEILALALALRGAMGCAPQKGQ